MSRFAFDCGPARVGLLGGLQSKAKLRLDSLSVMVRVRVTVMMNIVASHGDSC